MCYFTWKQELVLSTLWVIVEPKNFEFDVGALAEIWSGLVIDGTPVVAEFIENDAPVTAGTKSEEWRMSCSAITIFLTNCKLFRWKMLLVFSVIILESCAWKIFTTTHTSYSYEKRNWVGKRWQRCYIPVAVSEYFIAIHLDVQSSYKEISYGNTIQLFLSICETRFDQMTHMLRLWLVIWNYQSKNASQRYLHGHWRSYWKRNRAIATITNCSLSSTEAAVCDGVSRNGVGLDGRCWCWNFWSWKHR